MAAGKSRGLGRGLESLFDSVEIDTEQLKKGEGRERGDGILLVDINAMTPNAKQPRKNFNDEKIDELAQSIEMHGIIQPIMVRSTDGGYEIVAGERRWRAARRAGLKQVPCILRELDEQQNMLVALIENMQREDLNAIEEALAIDEMVKNFGLTQEEVSRSVGKSRPYITNALRLLRLPEEVQTCVRDGILSGGHARVLAGIKEEHRQITLAKKAVEEGWSVREMESHAGGRGEEKEKRPKAKQRGKNSEITRLEAQLKDTLGTKVNIEHNGKKGRIEIEYYSREELERLLELFLSLS